VTLVVPIHTTWNSLLCGKRRGTRQCTFTDIGLVGDDFELVGAELDGSSWEDTAAAPRRSRVAMTAASLPADAWRRRFREILERGAQKGLTNT
jgi:hypothetical protein